MFDIEDYDYDLPKSLIAQTPAATRDESRLLVVNRTTGEISDHRFLDLPGILKQGDLVVINDTRVVPARIFGRKESGGQVELLILGHDKSDNQDPMTRWCLVKSSKRPRVGGHLFFEDDISGCVEEVGEEGLTKIKFKGTITLHHLLEEKGWMPLPPYIKRGLSQGPQALDKERYQTIFAQNRGAVAAPTAGLHFSKDLVDRLDKRGISLTGLTLHVGHGTFRPVRARDIRDHQLGEEHYVISPGTAKTINRAKIDQRRVIAVGTTVVRTLETVAGTDGHIRQGSGETNLLITPGYRFKAIDGLITNFHLPKSSLLFLVAAFTGLELIKSAYRHAIERKYRFYSYGDAMLIL
jgi:S-adenosylmethionine:tRNA ribosyltransferase-isomerase